MIQVAPVARQLQQALLAAKTGQGTHGPNYNGNMLGGLIATILANLGSGTAQVPGDLLAIVQALDAAKDYAAPHLNADLNDVTEERRVRSDAQEITALLDAAVSAAGRLRDSLTMQPAIPEGWTLVKSSRLAEIAKFTVDPSQPAYQGRSVWDQQKVHSNWDACRINLESIREQIGEIDAGADREELTEAPQAHRGAIEPLPESSHQGEEDVLRQAEEICRRTVEFESSDHGDILAARSADAIRDLRLALPTKLSAQTKTYYVGTDVFAKLQDSRYTGVSAMIEKTPLEGTVPVRVSPNL